MGCIRVDKIVEYLEEPLRKTLKVCVTLSKAIYSLLTDGFQDESPYVRKTAAICVAKLFNLNPSLCLENGFLDTLKEMIGDSNPMVL